MGGFNTGGYTMNSLVQKMKDEADRKAAEEQKKKAEEERKRALQEAMNFRRDVPIGPPTAAQAGVEKPKIDLPQMSQPNYQVGLTEPGVSTATPGIESSMVSSIGNPEDNSKLQQETNTVSSRTKIPLPSLNPATPQPDPFNTQQAKWNPTISPQPPKNTGAISSLLPSVVPQLAPAIAEVGMNTLGQLGNIDWGNMDYRKAFENMPSVFQFQKADKESQQYKNNQMALDMFNAQIEQRFEEKKNVAIVPPLIPWADKVLNIPTNIGMGILNVGGSLLDLLGLGAELSMSGSVTPDGPTVKQVYANAILTGREYNNSFDNTAGNRVQNAIVAGAHLLDAVNPLSIAGPVSDYIFGDKKMVDFAPLLTPAAWTNLGSLGDYWALSADNMARAVEPDANQLKYNTTDEIIAAKNLAIYNAYSGPNAYEATFDDYLNTKSEGRAKATQAEAMAKLADMTIDEDARSILLGEAGKVAAQAAQMLETTPLDIYNRNFNVVTALPIMAAWDPLQQWGNISELAGLVPAARRAKQAAKLAEMPADAAAGSNKRVLDYVKDFAVGWMQTQRSKANVDSEAVFNVAANLMSGLSTKNDLVVGLQKLFNGEIINGIPAELLNGNDALMQVANGVYPTGWSGIKDFRFQEAIKSFPGIADQIPFLPSLIGEAGEEVNKALLQGDLIGMLTRKAAQTHDVSKLGDAPYVATKFRVKPTGANSAVVEYINQQKTLVGQSVEMTLRQANEMQASLAAALAKGDEYQTNFVRTVSDLRRNVQSTYSINSNVGLILGNALGGNLTPMLERGFDLEFFAPLEDGIEYVLKKGGGNYLYERMAQEIGNVGKAAQVASQSVVPTGNYDNFFGKLLNWSTFGLASKGKELRQGTGTLAGGRLKYGEGAMAGSVYYAGLKSFFEQEWERAIGPMMEQVLGSRVADPKVRKYMIDTITQAGLIGGREDLTKAWQNIVNGRVSMSIRSISPYLADSLHPTQVAELNDLLSGLNMDNLGQVSKRVDEIFDAQVLKAQKQFTQFVSEVSPVFTSADDSKDVADVANQLGEAAKHAGIPADQVTQRVELVKTIQQQVNEQLLQLAQAIQGNPSHQNYLLNVYEQLRNAKDGVRRRVNDARMEVARNFGVDVYGPQADVKMRTDAFNNLFEYTNAEWERYGEEGRRIVETARDNIINGVAQKAADAGLLNVIPGEPSLNPDFLMTEADVMEAISNMSLDPAEALKILQRPINSSDPAFKSNVELFQATVDSLQQRMFTMLMRFPNMQSFDQFNYTFKQVAFERHKLVGSLSTLKDKIQAAADIGDTAEAQRLGAELAQTAKYGWNKWWKYAIGRYEAGTHMIAEVNLPADIMDNLKFKRFATDKEWTLVGPDFSMPKYWQAKDADGNLTRFLTKELPSAVVDKWNDIRAVTGAQLQEQLGRMGVHAGINGTPAIDIDAALAKLGGQKETPEILNQIRARVAEALNSYKNPVSVPYAELPHWHMDKLNAGRQGLKQVLQEVAVSNAQGFGKLGLDAVSDFNRNILPMFDNIVTGAQQYGQKMVDLGMINFTKEYHPDILMSLYAPYHYWWSRMAKNALERQLFDPRLGQYVVNSVLSAERLNRANNEVNRNIQASPVGVNVGNDIFRLGMNTMFRWIPLLPGMAGNGWTDPQRANSAYDYLTEVTKENSFPATAKGWGSVAAMLHGMAQQAGLNSYAEYDDIMQFFSDEGLSPKDFKGRLGEMSGMHRSLGYAAILFSNWAKENNIPVVPAIADAYATITTPGYTPSLTARQAAFDVSQGKLTETQGKMVQDRARQDYTGAGPLPEQGMIAPDLESQYRAVQNKMATEYTVKSLISWLLSVSINTNYGGEAELVAAKEEKANAMYQPGKSEGGSQTARYSYTDPDSPNYVPGLSTYESRYKATQELAPQQDDTTQPRPGLDAAKSAYFDERAAIKEKYQQEEQAAYEAHPDWSTRQGGDAKKAFDTELKDRRDAEYEALDKKYPSVATGEFPEKTPYSLYGARPNETMRAAQDRLTQQAYANVEKLHPDKGDGSNKSWDVYNQALNDELTRLMSDPQAASDSVFGRALPQANPQQPGPTSDVLRNPYEFTDKTPVATINKDPRGPQVQAPTNTSVPPTQYDAQFSTAEQEFGLPAGMLSTLAKRESNYTPAPDNGYGMMQIEDAAWKQASDALNLTDREDPEQAIRAAAWYLNWVNDQLAPNKKDDPFWIAAGYNMGVNAVNKMTGQQDIINYDQYGPQRLSYANEIANASQIPQAQQPTQPSQPPGESFVNPNWGKKVGNWTVVGTPITDTGLTWVSPVPTGTAVYQNYGETDVDGLGNYYASKNQGFGHEGIDWMLPEGTHINSIADGVVIFVGDGKNDGRPAYGNMIVVEHPNGMKSRYGHLSGFGVSVGDSVTAGQYIGDVGHTPVTSNIGNHLHLSVESPFESTGPYRTVDPFRLIGQGASPQVAASTLSSAAPSTQMATKSPVGGDSGVAWANTPTELLDQAKAGNKSEARVAAETAVGAEFDAIEKRGKETYPQYANLWDEYKALEDNQKQDFTAANPMMRALNLAGYNPDEWAYVEETFGKGAVEKWALIPRGEDVGEAAGAYYRQYPEAFLTKAWIQGRPEPYNPDEYDPTVYHERDFGTDYETAKEMFGAGIWDTVKQYYTIPKYVKGGDNTQWLDFKEQHPEYDQWRAWWYALMGNEQATTSGFGSGYRGGYSGGYNGTNNQSGEHQQYVNRVDFRGQAPPKFNAGSSSGGDWRKYLSLGEVNLKNWRR